MRGPEGGMDPHSAFRSPAPLLNVIRRSLAGRVGGGRRIPPTLFSARVYAIRAGMTVSGLADTWAPYLTMSR